MITQIPPPEDPAPPKLKGRGSLVFRKGEVFRGEAIRDLGKGETLICARGRTFRALTDTTLRQGELHQFRVKEWDVNRRLPVLESSPPRPPRPGGRPHPLEGVTAVLRALTATRPPKGVDAGTATLLARLAEVLKGRLFHQGRVDPDRWVFSALNEGGTFWENRAAKYLLEAGRGGPGLWRARLGNDLKGMLLELQESLRNESRKSPGIDALGDQVKQAVELIQKAQLENLQLLREGGAWVFLLPGRQEEGSDEAELHLRGGSGGETRFSMFVELSSLGPVEIGGYVLGSSITVGFRVKDEQTAEWVREGLPSLHSALLDKGLMPANLACVAGNAAPRERGGGPAGGQQPDPVNLVV